MSERPEARRAPGWARAGRRREIVVLVVGLGSAAALAFAAFTALSSTRVAGAAAAARLAGEVATGITEEWNRWLAEAGPPAPFLSEPFVWNDEDREPVPAAVPDAWDEAGVDPAAGLLAEAHRLEVVDGDLGAALAVVRDALDTDSSLASRAEGRLRAIQLARRLGRDDVAAEQWAAMEHELDGRAARNGTAYLLLGLLAAGEHLPAEARRQAARSLQDLWVAGRLVIPGERLAVAVTGHDRGRVVVSPLRRALAARLEQLAERSMDIAERRVALAATVGPLPAATDDERWHLEVRGEVVFAWCRTVETDAMGGFMDTATLLRDFEQRLRRQGLLPDGFVFDIEGDRSDLGVALRDRAVLPADVQGDVLGYVLRHADLPALWAAGERRAAGQRGSLLVAALAIAVAAIVIARALRRERTLSDLKSAFIARVSHDLRTPVASILLMAENLQDGRVGADAAPRYHGLIRSEALRLRRMVDDVLDFSRLERGRAPELHLEDVALDRFVGEVVAAATEVVERAGCRLEVARGDVSGLAHLDADALRRAVLNLADNAARHSGSDVVELGVAVADNELCLTVADRGRGLPAGARAAVFEPFARLGATERGTGLGLSIVKEIVEAHGGRIAVRDREADSGTIFELTIPLEAREDERA